MRPACGAAWANGRRTLRAGVLALTRRTTVRPFPGTTSGRVRKSGHWVGRGPQVNRATFPRREQDDRRARGRDLAALVLAVHLDLDEAVAVFDALVDDLAATPLRVAEVVKAPRL